MTTKLTMGSQQTWTWLVATQGIILFMLAGCSPAPVATGIFTPSPEWSFETSEAIISTPIVAGDTVIVRTVKHLYVMDATTREIRLTLDSPGSIYGSAPPVLSDDGSIVIVPEDSNPFAAFDLATGQLLWRHCYLDIGQKDCSEARPGLYIGDLQISDGIVVVSDFDGDISAYDVETGIRYWVIDTPGRGGPSVAIDHGIVFFDELFIDGTVQLRAVDLRTGALKWYLEMSEVMGKLVAREGTVYYTTSVGDMARVGAISGDKPSRLWTSRVNAGLGSKDTYLTLNDDSLYVSGNQLSSFSISNGALNWRKGDLAGFMRPIPFKTIILTRDKHLLYAFDVQTGRELGRLSLELEPGRSNVEINPTVYGDLLLVPAKANQIAAYRLVANP